MKKLLKFYKLKIAVLLSLVIFSSCVFDNKPKLIIVNDFHKTRLPQHLDPITEKYELPRLRDFSLYRDDLEVRVWVSIGFSGTDGFIFRRFDRQWSAVAIKEIDCNKFNYWKKDRKYSVGKINLSEPKSGWQNVWQKLLEAEILDLPDYSEVPERNGYLDGWGYFVEINRNGKYRSYTYPNPNAPRSTEEEKMIKIGEIISEEFNLHNFKDGSLCIEK